MGEPVGVAKLPAFLRLVRIAKLATLVADIWTIFYAVLIVGWQMAVLLRDGTWPSLPLSAILNMLATSRGGIVTTASIGEAGKSHHTSVIDALLAVPAIVPLLLAAALLTAFYLWLNRTEKQYSTH